MEDILTSFGVDTRLILIQVVNFLILMTALGYFLYTPILKLLRERSEQIATGLKNAEAAGATLAAAEAEKQDVIRTAHAEASEVTKRAKANAAQIETEIVDEARTRAGAVLTHAETEAGRIREEARKAAEADIAKAAVLMAEQILRDKTKV